MKKFLLISFALLLFIKFSDSQWTKLNTFPSIYATDIIFSGDTLFVSTLGNGFYFSFNAGEYWIQLNSGLNSPEALQLKQLMKTGLVIYAATVDGIYKSTNRGLNWVKKSNGIVVGGGALYAFAESINSFNGKMFTGTYTGIYSSTDGAESWQQTNIFGSAVIAKNFTLHNGIMFAARETNNTPYAYISTDGGITWNQYNGLNFPTITFLSEPPVIWAGTIDGVWLSTNDGLSWQMRNNGLSLDPYSSSIIRVNGTLVTSLKFGGSGVYRSSNNGTSWEEIGQGLPFLSSIEKLIMFNGKVIAATNNGLYQRDISEIIVGVKKQNGEIPQSYNLYQNYPNPFNPETKIKFRIPESNVVNLTVYDIQGREVSVLANERLSQGTYEVGWDASNYPSGIYYYRLKTNGYTETRKMILLK